MRSYAKFWGDLAGFLAFLGAICEEPAKVRVPPPEIPAVVFLFSRKYCIDLANNALYNIYIELGDLSMEKIIAVTFDIADQKCKMYNALEWHNFIADTREMLLDEVNYPEQGLDSLEELFDYAYGDEFWFELAPYPKAVYQVAFDLRCEEFIICSSDAECEMIQDMAAESGDDEEIFWAE